MKYCLKLALVLALISELLGVGIGSYYAAPANLPDAGFVARVDVDQQSGTYVVHRYYDSLLLQDLMDRPHVNGRGGYDWMLQMLSLDPKPAEKKHHLTFSQRPFYLRAKGIPQECLAQATILYMDKSRLCKRDSFIRLVSGIPRDRSPEQLATTLLCRKYIDQEALTAMPFGQGYGSVVLHYFHLQKEHMIPQQIAVEYARRDLVPDAQAQIIDNHRDPMLAYSFPNAMQWIFGSKVYALTFDEDAIGCNLCTDWYGDWWFAGVKRS